MPKKFEDLKNAILVNLKKEVFNKSDKELEFMANEVASSIWKTKQKTIETKKDSEGNIIIGENVKLILEANIACVGVIEE